MKSHNKQLPFGGMFLGLALFAAAALAGNRHWLPGVEVLVLLAVGFIIYLAGCAGLARAKGYTVGQGILLGVIFPALLVLLMPDRNKMSKAEREQDLSEEADGAKATRAAKLRPLKGPKKGLAWLLGLFFFAVGLAAIVGYEIYWARVVVPERAGMTTANSINADKLDSQNEGKLVHLIGGLSGVENLTDPEFGVAVDALRLRRRVWMYQWQQGGVQSRSSLRTEDANGNTTTWLKTRTYFYSKNWSEKLIDSRSFYNAGHDNPAAMPVPALTVAASKISLGSFDLATELVTQLENFQTVPVNEKNLSAFTNPLHAQAKLSGDGIYLGINPDQPAIGDVKIRFESAPAATVTVIARQSGNKLSPYAVTKSGLIAQLRVGTYSVQEMTGQFAKEQFKRRVLVWVFGGFTLLFGLLVITVARRR
jgi:hypothetical protein